jgi:aryl-alcohol dehydrogenase-like predicted oxidoreductase
MLMRKLGRSGLKVAALCLGGNTFGWTTDQKGSEAVLDAYVEAGGNFIDTADVYSRGAPGNKGGESETVLGAWMAARRNRQAIVMGTKVCGPMGPGPNDAGLPRQHIMQGVEASLAPSCSARRRTSGASGTTTRSRRATRWTPPSRERSR